MAFSFYMFYLMICKFAEMKPQQGSITCDLKNEIWYKKISFNKSALLCIVESYFDENASVDLKIYIYIYIYIYIHIYEYAGIIAVFQSGFVFLLYGVCIWNGVKDIP